MKQPPNQNQLPPSNHNNPQTTTTSLHHKPIKMNKTSIHHCQTHRNPYHRCITIATTTQPPHHSQNPPPYDPPKSTTHTHDPLETQLIHNPHAKPKTCETYHPNPHIPLPMPPPWHLPIKRMPTQGWSTAK